MRRPFVTTLFLYFMLSRVRTGSRPQKVLHGDLLLVPDRVLVPENLVQKLVATAQVVASASAAAVGALIPANGFQLET